jgi:hypothetical protein
MEINRNGPRKPHLENPAQKTDRTDARFNSSVSQSFDAGATEPPVGIPPGVTQADLRDARKAEETLMRCFGELVDDVGRRLGVPISDVERRNLLEFLAQDPLTRGKLLKYLEQVVK